MKSEKAKLHNANNLLDAVIEKLELKNDAALSRLLEVRPPVISKIRNQKLPVGPVMLIRLHEESGISIRDLKSMIATNDNSIGKVHKSGEEQ